ncbi:hypothetical protein SUDANB148_02969 [Streptomyces sp. SudanB148_2056]
MTASEIFLTLASIGFTYALAFFAFIVGRLLVAMKPGKH